jgi:queuosine precursor transporter
MSAPATITIPRSLFIFSLVYGGLVCMAGVLGSKIAQVGSLSVESGIFAFLQLVVISSAVAELHGRNTANRLVRYGFIPLILSFFLIRIVIEVPHASFWDQQGAFEKLLGQSSRMMFAGLISYGTSQTLNVYVFSRLAEGQGRLLWLRALVASLLSQVVDTLIFVTIAFYGVFPIAQMMTGQIIAKMVLSIVMVPPLIYAAVALGRWLDREGVPA